MKASIAIAVGIGVAGAAGAAVARNEHVREALKREADLLGLRAYLAAVDRVEPHRRVISELRHGDLRQEGSWLFRAYHPARTPAAAAQK